VSRITQGSAARVGANAHLEADDGSGANQVIERQVRGGASFDPAPRRDGHADRPACGFLAQVVVQAGIPDLVAGPDQHISYCAPCPIVSSLVACHGLMLAGAPYPGLGQALCTTWQDWTSWIG
jgi:hypothetical protein